MAILTALIWAILATHTIVIIKHAYTANSTDKHAYMANSTIDQGPSPPLMAFTSKMVTSIGGIFYSSCAYGESCEAMPNYKTQGLLSYTFMSYNLWGVDVQYDLW